MAYPNPIGYWVSTRESHPAHRSLTELEKQFGSFFEAFDLADLHALLSYCAVESDDSGSWISTRNREFSNELHQALELIDNLDATFQLGLARFLVEIISARGTAR